MGDSSLPVSKPGRTPRLSGTMLGMALNSRPALALTLHRSTANDYTPIPSHCRRALRPVPLEARLLRRRSAGGERITHSCTDKTWLQ